ncbi:MAG: hypothetical protein QOG88_1248 [Actinomycetota bacterium]|nr:hypothetical protein [Actinomycetota bacterium]
MKIIDRFTRDRVSRYIWALLTIGFLVGALFAQQRPSRVLADEVSAAQLQTRQLANTVLFRNLTYATMIAPIPAPLYRDTVIELQAFTRPPIALVRVWRPDGILQFSTHERDQVGLLQTEDTTLIDQAMKGQSVSARVLTTFSATSTGQDVPTNLLAVFVPLHVPDRISIAGVAEVDYYYDRLVEDSQDPWHQLVLVSLGLAGLCLILTLLSFRRPIRTLGAGVGSGLDGAIPEPPSGKHAGGPPSDRATRALQRQAGIAEDRATKAEEEAARMREQLGESHEQLTQAEEAYHFLEAKMKQTQADLEMAGPADQPNVGSRVQVLEEELAHAEERASTAERWAREAEDRATTTAITAAETAAEAAAALASAGAAQAAMEAAENAQPAAADENAFAQLEERILAAEQRARDAETTLTNLQEALAPAPEEVPLADGAAAVDDLRLRLARTAARKRLGHDDSPPPSSAAAPIQPASPTSGPQADLQRSMAGEIRGPLSTLKGLSLSLKGVVGTGEGKELVRQMNASVKKLDRLASDLAEVGEISDGSLRLNRRRTDLEALVSRVVSEADGVNQLDVRMELQPASASVDPARLQQIVDGMLNHARERTSASGTIRIRLTGGDDGATIAVDDEGAPETELGPQLLLASRLAELHGGRLWSEPRTAGPGSSVKVFLPQEPDHT